MRKLTARSLLDVQIATRAQIEGIENHCDQIGTNLLLGVIYLSKLLPSLGLQSLDQGRVKAPEVLDICAKVLEHTMLLCDSCNYDIPDEEELKEFELSIPKKIKNDAIMTVLSMIESFTDTAHLINVELEEPIWAEDEIPEDFESNIFNVIIGIKNLGSKFSFTMDDVLDKMTG